MFDKSFARIAVVAGVSLNCVAACLSFAGAPELRLGVGQHAFDHLGPIGEQADAAAQSGQTIIYATGLGGLGYQGLPDAERFLTIQRETAEYVRGAKRKGIRLVIGYVCATSIVKLEGFDRNWSPKFRGRFATPVSDWRQQDREGKPLRSWYGGDYEPACMNNPDWRAYEKFIVRRQLELGCEGIFFDNPTVHPQGCYCRHCMEKFRQFLAAEKIFPAESAEKLSVENLRAVASTNGHAFMRFRCTIARDFFAEMRAYARSIKPAALITANNSLNSTDVLYTQCRSYAYNIFEMAKAEDFIVIEDQASQPRTLPGGRTFEYGPSYRQVLAISHGKPVVAVTIADGDYHTPPNLVRLAMAEAAANGAAYMLWPTWPETERARMISLVRPQAKLLRANEELLNGTRARSDVVLFLPFRRWIETDRCAASGIATELSRANIQYEIVCEQDLRSGVEARIFSKEFRFGRIKVPKMLQRGKIFLAESPSVLNESEREAVENFERRGGVALFADQKDWMHKLRQTLSKPSLVLDAPATVRVVVRDQPVRTVIHLFNLNVERVSSFQDKVNPAADVRLTVRVPFPTVRSVRAWSADTQGRGGDVEFTSEKDDGQTVVRFTVPRLEIATIVVCEP